MSEAPSITKLMSARLGLILSKILSCHQSAFVAGREMADNIRLVQERVISINKKVHGGNIIFNLYISKAHDIVNCVFLINVLRQFGLCELWIDLVWKAISNCWFSGLVNGEPTSFFSSSRGLWQGNTLSHTLSIVAAEVFSISLNCRMDEGKIQPYLTITNVPTVSHIAYGDDILIFTNGGKSIKELMRLIEEYKGASVQLINK